MNVADVSVVIPNYNRIQPLLRAIRSVALQTWKPNEVIVVDDCSDVDKLSEIEKVIDSFKPILNIRLLRNMQNRGANYSRNRGIFESSSRYVAFLDSDDLWMPRKLELQLSKIEGDAGVGLPVLSATGRYRVDAEGKIFACQFGGELFTPSKIKASNFVGTLSSVVVDTCTARRVNGLHEGLPACQDWDFFIRLAEHVRYVGVPQPLCVYVDHDEERITRQDKKRLKAHVFVYRKHIRGADASVSRAIIYRNIAEIYQDLGNLKRAARFFAAHKVNLNLHRQGYSGMLLALFWQVFYKLWKPNSIKRNRYSAYRRILAKRLRSQSIRTETERDQALIDQLMSLRAGDGDEIKGIRSLSLKPSVISHQCLRRK